MKIYILNQLLDIELLLNFFPAIFVNEEDIGTYTIKAADDPRTLNKIVYIRPPGNTYTHNELVSLWEKKTGKTLKRIYLTEEEVVKKIQGERELRV